MTDRQTQSRESDSRDERAVICEECGDVIGSEPVGGPEDQYPELGDADRLLPAEECPFCDEGLEG